MVNIFFFSERTAEIDPRFLSVIEMLRTGQFGNFEELENLINSVTDGRDYYLLGYDFGGCTLDSVVMRFRSLNALV